MLPGGQLHGRCQEPCSVCSSSGGGGSRVSAVSWMLRCLLLRSNGASKPLSRLYQVEGDYQHEDHHSADAAAEASLAALDLVENNNINIDSDDDDWSAYFSSLGMPDMPDMDDLHMEEPLVVPPLVVPIVPLPPLVVPLQNRHRRRGRVPIDPLTSTEEAILAGLIAASPENKVKIRQRYMSRRRVRARLGI